MKNTMKKFTFASLATLALAGAFTVTHTTTVSANTDSITDIHSLPENNSKRLIQKIKDSKNSIKKNIKEKMNNPKIDYQKVSERVLGNDDYWFEDFMGTLDLNYVEDVDELSELSIETKKDLVKDNHLEAKLLEPKYVKYSKYLEELAEYYECLDLYFAIDFETTSLANFEYYLAFSPDAHTRAEGEKTRYSSIIKSLLIK